MRIINFAHPLTEAQLEDIKNIAGKAIEGVMEVSSHVDTSKNIEDQVQQMLHHTGLSTRQWQTEAILINLPALNFSAAVMLAQLHGLMGYFPSVLRLRPVEGEVPPRYMVAEIMHLQETRERSRKNR